MLTVTKAGILYMVLLVVIAIVLGCQSPVAKAPSKLPVPAKITLYYLLEKPIEISNTNRSRLELFAHLARLGATKRRSEGNDDRCELILADGTKEIYYFPNDYSHTNTDEERFRMSVFSEAMWPLAFDIQRREEASTHPKK